jgi:hypothetical protein
LLHFSCNKGGADGTALSLLLHPLLQYYLQQNAIYQ